MTSQDGIHFTIFETESGERIDRYLAQRLEGVTRAAVQRWIIDGRVTVDGQPCRAKDKLLAGAIVVVRPDLPPASSAEPDPTVVFDVVYEDDALLVVNKPAGLVVHPGRGHRHGTLVNGLLARPGFERITADPRDPEGRLRPGIVHRIDKDTSGLLVVAKTEQAREGLKAQLARHSMDRSYRALSIGVPEARVIHTLYGRDPQSRLRFSCKVTRGKEAVTAVELIEVLAAGRAAHLRCRLRTGRTHQIRVHLSQECRTPLLGDQLYGGMVRHSALSSLAQQLGRQALHAELLGFVHPLTGVSHRFESELPQDMQAAYCRLRELPA